MFCYTLFASVSLGLGLWSQEPHGDMGVTYKITALYPKADSSYAWGINNRGQVVGDFSISGKSESLAYLWENGTVQVIGTLSDQQAGRASGINALGHVVASAFNGGTETPRHAFLWQGGKLERLFSDKRNSQALAINDKDEVVGTFQTRWYRSHAFLWIKGKATDLGTLKGGSSVALAINSNGRVVGYADYSNDTHGFVWWRGSMLDMGTLGGKASESRGINDRGQVVGGASTVKEETHACLWEKGRLHDLGTPGKGLCYANAVNNRGQIVGEWMPEGKGVQESHALVWVRQRLYDLNSLIPKGSGWVLNSAKSINDSGEIVGNGVFRGKFCAFILTPVSTRR